MTRVYMLIDHQCVELAKLLDEGKVSYEYFVCGCSPIERHYQILEDGNWKDIDNCPYCNVSMTGIAVHPTTIQGSGMGLSGDEFKQFCSWPNKKPWGGFHTNNKGDVVFGDHNISEERRQQKQKRSIVCPKCKHEFDVNE